MRSEAIRSQYLLYTSCDIFIVLYTVNIIICEPLTTQLTYILDPPFTSHLEVMWYYLLNMVTVIVDIYYHSVGAYIAGLRAPSAKGRHGNTTQIKSRIMFSANLLNGSQRAVPFCMICSLDMVTGLPWTKQTRACELDSCPIFQLASLAPVHCT